MKKLLLIWIGAIVALILVGVLWGAIFGTENNAEIPQTEITYIDDEGNEVTEIIPDAPIDVTINGKNYTYNPYVWAGKDIKIDGTTFSAPHYYATYEEAGFYPQQNTWFKKDKQHNLYIQRNTYYGHMFTLAAYSSDYTKITNVLFEYCDDVVLPGNVKLGSSTKEYIEKLYGNSYETTSRNEKIITVKYYATSDKRGERISLTYDAKTNILIGFEWAFDTRNV